MTDEQLDTEIRKALDARAHEVDVPVDLMTRTLERARAGTKRSLRDRLRARLDAWRMRLPVTGYPRWLYAGAAVAMVLLFFGIGTLAMREPGQLYSRTRTESTGADRDLSGTYDAVPQKTGTGATTERPAEGRADRVLSNTSRDADRSGGAGAAFAPAPAGPPAPAGKFPPKIVRTTSLEIEVESFDRGWERANDVASRHQGFVVTSNTEQTENERGRGTLQIRVPAAKLDAATKELRALGTLRMMNTSAEDVAAQLVDLDARRRAAEAEELQLLELVRQARGVPEVLEVRRRLNSVRKEIETLKAQQAYQADQVDFATINATIFERGAEPEKGEPASGVLADAWRTAVHVGLGVLAGLLVVLGALIPLLIIATALWAGVRLVRRRSSA
jgi:uncharacterized protein DUF4349